MTKITIFIAGEIHGDPTAEIYFRDKIEQCAKLKIPVAVGTEGTYSNGNNMVAFLKRTGSRIEDIILLEKWISGQKSKYERDNFSISNITDYINSNPDIKNKSFLLPDLSQESPEQYRNSIKIMIEKVNKDFVTIQKHKVSFYQTAADLNVPCFALEKGNADRKKLSLYSCEDDFLSLDQEQSRIQYMVRNADEPIEYLRRNGGGFLFILEMGARHNHRLAAHLFFKYKDNPNYNINVIPFNICPNHSLASKHVMDQLNLKHAINIGFFEDYVDDEKIKHFYQQYPCPRFEFYYDSSRHLMFSEELNSLLSRMMETYIRVVDPCDSPSKPIDAGTSNLFDAAPSKPVDTASSNPVDTVPSKTLDAASSHSIDTIPLNAINAVVEKAHESKTLAEVIPEDFDNDFLNPTRTMSSSRKLELTQWRDQAVKTVRMRLLTLEQRYLLDNPNIGNGLDKRIVTSILSPDMLNIDNFNVPIWLKEGTLNLEKRKPNPIFLYNIGCQHPSKKISFALYVTDSTVNEPGCLRIGIRLGTDNHIICLMKLSKSPGCEFILNHFDTHKDQDISLSLGVFKNTTFERADSPIWREHMVKMFRQGFPCVGQNGNFYLNCHYQDIWVERQSMIFVDHSHHPGTKMEDLNSYEVKKSSETSHIYANTLLHSLKKNSSLGEDNKSNNAGEKAIESLASGGIPSSPGNSGGEMTEIIQPTREIVSEKSDQKASVIQAIREITEKNDRKVPDNIISNKDYDKKKEIAAASKTSLVSTQTQTAGALRAYEKHLSRMKKAASRPTSARMKP